MKFKEFSKWCNDRTCDGCWGMNTAITCISVLEEVNSKIFFKRERYWKTKFEENIVNNIVIQINKEIERLKHK